MSQLPTAGADIEQIAGLPEALTDQRRHACDIVGAVDRRGVELDGINRLRRPGTLRRARLNLRPRPICVTTKGTDTTIPAATTRHRELPPLAPNRFAVWCDRSGNIRTPRLLRPRVTSRWQVSWLTGHRRRPPSREHAPFSVALLVEGSPLTVAGAAAALCKRTHRVPF
jgi:hypothetical protein